MDSAVTLLLTPNPDKCADCKGAVECMHRTCAICLDGIAVEKEVVCVSECEHIYHEPCIRAWLVRQTKCINQPANETDLTDNNVRRCPVCRGEMHKYVVVDSQAKTQAHSVDVNSEFGVLLTDLPPARSAHGLSDFMLPGSFYSSLMRRSYSMPPAISVRSASNNAATRNAPVEIQDDGDDEEDNDADGDSEEEEESTSMHLPQRRGRTRRLLALMAAENRLIQHQTESIRSLVNTVLNAPFLRLEARQRQLELLRRGSS